MEAAAALWESNSCPLQVHLLPSNMSSAVCVLCAQSRPTLCNPMDCSLPGSSVHGIFPARQEYCNRLSFPPPGDLSNPGIETVSCVSACIGRWILLPPSHLGSPVQWRGLEAALRVTAASVQLCAALPASHPSRSKLVNVCLMSLLVNSKSGTNWY